MPEDLNATTDKLAVSLENLKAAHNNLVNFEHNPNETIQNTFFKFMNTIKDYVKANADYLVKIQESK